MAEKGRQISAVPVHFGLLHTHILCAHVVHSFRIRTNVAIVKYLAFEQQSYRISYTGLAPDIYVKVEYLKLFQVVVKMSWISGRQANEHLKKCAQANH